MKEFINIALRIENKTKTGDIIPYKSHQFVCVLSRFFIVFPPNILYTLKPSDLYLFLDTNNHYFSF